MIQKLLTLVILLSVLPGSVSPVAARPLSTEGDSVTRDDESISLTLGKSDSDPISPTPGDDGTRYIIGLHESGAGEAR